MVHVFSSEGEFLAAPAATRLNRHGYRVTHGTQTYFVWAATSTQAMGLVAKHTQAMSSEVYNQREIKHNTSAPATIDPKMVGYVTKMTPDQQQKLREILLRSSRDSVPSSV